MRYLAPDFLTGERAAGLLVLSSDEAMESELRHWLPPDICLHHARVSNANVINRDSLAAMLGEIPRAVQQLPPAADYRVIAYGCTSGAMVIGSERVQEAVQGVMPGVAVSDPFTALKARLDFVGARRLGLLVPYEPDVAQGIIEGFEEAGYDIVDAVSYHESRDDRVSRIAPRSVREGLLSVGVSQDVDAVVASCTNLRSVTVLDEVTASLGKPVMTSNSALAWHIESLCGD